MYDDIGEWPRCTRDNPSAEASKTDEALITHLVISGCSSLWVRVFNEF
jgi:hypothetical protein